MFNPNELKKLLSEYPKEKVELYVDYCNKVATDKKSNGQISNTWFTYRTNKELSDYFKGVMKDKLDFDGKHITILKTGVSYDYIAYKNKMFLAYPESVIDVQLVKESDKFSFEKVSGSINYNHIITNPFGNEKIVGGYCVIKNKRGEFLTVLSEEDFMKHRKIAKTHYIWDAWEDEMRLKTVIKKACKTHFADIYQNIETIDNENYDLETSLDLSQETLNDIEKLTTIDECLKYYNDNKDKNAGILKEFTKELTKRKEQIKEGF